MLAKEQHNSKRERKTMIKTNTFRISLMLFTLALPTISRADTVQRFIYEDIADTATLRKGGHELDYRLLIENWDMSGWDIDVIRNELTYRYGLTDRTEIGISPMHSYLMYCYKGYWNESESGFNDLLLYGKHQVLKEPDSPVTISIGARAFAPTGSTGGWANSLLFLKRLELGDFPGT